MNQAFTQVENPVIIRLRHLTCLAPHDPDLRLSLAKELILCSRPAEAITEIRAAISMAPNHLEARKLLQGAMTMNESQPS